jgi:hypothetical protein
MPAGFVATAVLRQMLVCGQRRNDWLTAIGVWQLPVKWVSGLEVLEFSCAHRECLHKCSHWRNSTITETRRDSSSSSSQIALQSNADLRFLSRFLPFSSIFDLSFQAAVLRLLYICLYTVSPFRVLVCFVGRVSSVDIATGYELHGLGIVSRWKIFRTSTDRPWTPPGSCTMVSFPGCKTAGEWRRPPIPI